MSESGLGDILKTYPDVWGHKIGKEKTERVNLRGIGLTIKRYVCEDNSTGIRIPIKENDSVFMKYFSEYLIMVDKQRSDQEKSVGVFSFETLATADQELGKLLSDVGYYVYADHIILHDEKKGPKPFERLENIVEYYRAKFQIKVKIKEETFAELDGLEL